MRIPAIALIILFAFSAAEARENKVGVVVTVQGPVKLKRRKEDTGKARTDLKILMTLNEGDKLVIPAKSEVTVTVLSSGIRYTLIGPLLEVPVPADGAFKVDKSQLRENRQAGREGIVAANSVDMKKMGGGSGRSLARVYSYSTAPQMHLDVINRAFDITPTSVRYRNAGDPNAKWLQGGVVVRHQDDGKTVVVANPGLFQAGQTYEIQLSNDPPPSGQSSDVWLHCLSPEIRQKVEKIESTTGQDLPSQVELFETYKKLQLFDKAEDKLRQIQKASPSGLNWPQQWEEFEVERKAAQKGDGGNSQATDPAKSESTNGEIKF